MKNKDIKNIQSLNSKLMLCEELSYVKATTLNEYFLIFKKKKMVYYLQGIVG